jgi:hypothetical protein
MKIVLVVIVGIFLIFSLVNNFYSPEYCKKFWWEAPKIGDALIIWLKKCEDNVLCRVWSKEEKKVNGVIIKSWSCKQVFDEFHVLD